MALKVGCNSRLDFGSNSGSDFIDFGLPNGSQNGANNRSKIEVAADCLKNDLREPPGSLQGAIWSHFGHFSEPKTRARYAYLARGFGALRAAFSIDFD